MKKQNGFFEWLVVKESPDPESAVPLPLYDKPPPPRKRRRRRYEKSTQTDFGKTKKFPPVVPKTIPKMVQSNPPPQGDRRYMVYFISGIMIGIFFKKYIKN